MDLSIVLFMAMYCHYVAAFPIFTNQAELSDHFPTKNECYIFMIFRVLDRRVLFYVLDISTWYRLGIGIGSVLAMVLITFLYWYWLHFCIGNVYALVLIRY